MTDGAPAPLNTDLNGVIDHIKWMYFAQSHGLAWLHYRLAELTGTGKLDPEANWELQYQLSEMSDRKTPKVSGSIRQGGWARQSNPAVRV
jgi:hypothetical protein